MSLKQIVGKLELPRSWAKAFFPNTVVGVLCQGRYAVTT